MRIGGLRIAIGAQILVSHPEEAGRGVALSGDRGPEAWPGCNSDLAFGKI